jgi:hypothetical protein
MKKLGKLTISREKIMKNEELINQQGGYQGWCCWCGGHGFMGGVDNAGECETACRQAYNTFGDWIC